MRTRVFLPIALIVAVFHSASGDLGAQISAVALNGMVSSEEEGSMEGVIVTAKRDTDPAFTVSVVTDDRGHYRFPRTHVGPGRYSLQIRAVGYVLPGPYVVEVKTATTATADLKLQKTTNLAAQLTNLEWVMSFPGTREQKDGLVRQAVNCGFCHSYERITRSRYTSEQWVAVIRRMSTYNVDHSGSIRANKNTLASRSETTSDAPEKWWNIPVKDLAQYLGELNLSGGKTTWPYTLQTLPRPKGRATRIIVTVYDIPRQPSVIHDLDVDSKGNVWYGNTGWDYIGKLEPKTGSFSEWVSPNFLPAPPAMLGVMDVQVDREDDLWAAVPGPKLARFDTKTERWTSYDLPHGRGVLFLAPFRNHLETHWSNGGVYANRLNTRTGKVDAFNLYENAPPGPHASYMIERDSRDNAYVTDFTGSYIVRVDGKTGAVKFYPTPTPNSFPRRGHIDSNDRFWFGEFWADNIGMFDTRTEQFQEFPVQPKYISPYYARTDKNGDIWVSTNGSDRLIRFNPATREIVQYLMPVYYDARKVVPDPTTGRVTIWLPNKNTSQIIRVEALD